MQVTAEEEGAREAEEAHRETMKTNDEYKQPPPKPKPTPAAAVEVEATSDSDTGIEELEPGHDKNFDVIIVGAGAAGIGQAFTLTHTFGLDPSKVLLIER